jgi:hypothetical protein
MKATETTTPAAAPEANVTAQEVAQPTATATTINVVTVPTKTAGITELIKLGYTRREISEMMGVGYGFVQNVFAKFAESEEGKLHRYIEIQQQLETLEAELKGITDQVIETADGKQVRHEKANVTYTFNVKNAKEFTYSPAITAAENKLKAMKKAEEKDGTATARLTPHLMLNR